MLEHDPQQLAPTNATTVPPDVEHARWHSVVEKLADVALLVIVVGVATAVMVAFVSEPGPTSPWAIRYLVWCRHTLSRLATRRPAPVRRD